ANGMAALLGRGLSEIAGITITQKIQANEVFAIVPREHVARLQGESYFHLWDEGRSEARFVASFDTTEEEVTKFVAAARAILSSESELRPRRA
ncbi:MAG: threonine aldolase, partial [Gemmatimonadota bacterium]|nr:threonine aldolase [Gemmatimonadota bacterium]